METQRRVANALGGKTARACDSCLTKRARWFCAADDAFLCQGCDASVHSANQVASRHERVRLDTSSSRTNNCSITLEDSLPAWHGGFTKRARTSRNHNTKSSYMQQFKEGQSLRNINTPPQVPELSCDETAPIDNDENLIFRVPVFDPLDYELGKMSNEVESIFTDEIDIRTALDKYDHAQTNELDDFSEFLPCDMDLAELAANVENLLGDGTGEDFGLANFRQDGAINIFFDDSRVKVEDGQEFEDILAPQIDSTFNCSQFITKEEEADMVIPIMEEDEMKGESEVGMKRNMFLKLNYEAVLAAWGGQGLPWTTGSRPEFNPDDYFNGTCPTNDGHQHKLGAMKKEAGNASDGGREARVSRYREKRRTRLFSKKIRYEVRKRNAEKRPRIKGRFVKRTSLFAGPPNATVYPYIN